MISSVYGIGCPSLQTLCIRLWAGFIMSGCLVTSQITFYLLGEVINLPNYMATEHASHCSLA